MRGSVAASLAVAALSTIAVLLVALPGRLLGPERIGPAMPAPGLPSAPGPVEARLPAAPRKVRVRVVKTSKLPVVRSTPRRHAAPRTPARVVAVPQHRSAPPAPVSRRAPTPRAAPAASPQPTAATTPAPAPVPVPVPVPAAAPLPAVAPLPTAVEQPKPKPITPSRPPVSSGPVVALLVAAGRDAAGDRQAECDHASGDKTPWPAGGSDRNCPDGVRPLEAVAGEAAPPAAGPGPEARHQNRDDRREAGRDQAPQAPQVDLSLGR